MSAHDDKSKARLGIAITMPTITRSVNAEGRWKKNMMYVAKKRTGSTINVVDANSHTRVVSHA